MCPFTFLFNTFVDYFIFLLSILNFFFKILFIIWERERKAPSGPESPMLAQFQNPGIMTWAGSRHSTNWATPVPVLVEWFIDYPMHSTINMLKIMHTHITQICLYLYTYMHIDLILVMISALMPWSLVVM